jgi:CRP-like cAMP-binding protein
MNEINTLSLDERKLILSKPPLFQLLDSEELHELATLTEDRAFDAGTYIVKKGDIIDSVYIIISGVAVVTKTIPNEQRIVTIATLKDFDSIGLNAVGFFSESGIRSNDVISKSSIKLLKIDLIKLKNFLQKPEANSSFASLKNINDKLVLMGFMQRINLFHHLTNEIIKEIAQKVQRCYFKKGEYICKQDEIANACYFLISGGVSVFVNNSQQNNALCSLDAPSVIGEPAFLKDGVYSASVIADKHCECFAFTKADLLQLISKNKKYLHLIELSRIEHLVYRPVPEIVLKRNENTSATTDSVLLNEVTKFSVSVSPQEKMIWNDTNGDDNLRSIQSKLENFSLDFIYSFLERLRNKGFVTLVSFEFIRPRKPASIFVRIIKYIQSLFISS